MARSVRFAFGVVLAALSGPSFAQQGPDQVQARQIYEKVITFRTSEGNGQVPPMVAYLETVLRDGGVPADNIAKLPKGETVGMLVRVPGSDPKAKPILFSAHMDVVDARPEDWKRDPYKLIEEGGFFYGRGTLDNKAGVVAMTSTILRLQKSGKKPRRTLVFAFVGDECVAGSIALPDSNPVVKRMNGRIFPFGWWHAWRGGKNIDAMRVLVLGVKHRYQKLGFGAPIYQRTWAEALRRGYRGADASLVLDNNRRMRSALEKLGGRVYMTYRAYERNLGA